MIHYKDECLIEILSQVKLIREISRSNHNYYLGLKKKKSPLKKYKKKMARHRTNKVLVEEIQIQRNLGFIRGTSLTAEVQQIKQFFVLKIMSERLQN